MAKTESSHEMDVREALHALELTEAKLLADGFPTNGTVIGYSIQRTREEINKGRAETLFVPSLLIFDLMQGGGLACSPISIESMKDVEVALSAVTDGPEALYLAMKKHERNTGKTRA